MECSESAQVTQLTRESEAKSVKIGTGAVFSYLKKFSLKFLKINYLFILYTIFASFVSRRPGQPFNPGPASVKIRTLLGRVL